MTVRESGRDAVMVNCNPETVSTDYDTSDRLYFEPLTLEDVLAIVEIEQPEGVIVSFGGQTPLRLAGGPGGGRRDAARHAARGDRPRRGPRPLRRAAGATGAQGAAVRARADAGRGARRRARRRLPAARPPVLRARRARDGARLRHGPCSRTTSSARGRRARSSSTASSRTRSRSTWTPSATARTSGSAASCSTSRRPGSTRATRPARFRRTHSVRRCSTRSGRASRDLALALGVVGLINIQYAVYGDDLYMIEANPRASRTVPFVSKATGQPLAKIACRVMLGEKLAAMGLPEDPCGPHVSVKEAVLPFDRFAGADALLGPEMRSTGEVMGVATDFPAAFAKAQAAAGTQLPEGRHGVPDRDRFRQGGGDGHRRPAARSRVPDRGHARDGVRDQADGHSGGDDQQDPGRLTTRPRLDRPGRRRPRDQHARRAPPHAATGTRSDARRWRAACPASRRSRAGWRPLGRSARPASGSLR